MGDPRRPAVLVLAGTTEAAALLAALDAEGAAPTASFAGRTRTTAALPPGVAVRTGGFGGVDGLAAALVEGRYDAVVDATHPFAAQMSRHVALAADRLGVPRLRLVRPPWTEVAGDRWHRVADLGAAADAVRALGARRVLLTTGRMELGPFAAVAGVHFLTRSVEAPDPLPLADATVLLDRGPFTVAGERALLAEHAIELVVTKDSGGRGHRPEAGRRPGGRPGGGGRRPTRRPARRRGGHRRRSGGVGPRPGGSPSRVLTETVRHRIIAPRWNASVDSSSSPPRPPARASTGCWPTPGRRCRTSCC
ncbi:precorrin-6A/cobalt-precorrin-6A reductase [Aquihabitans sp. G128]|nr:precorrin-6A/cobalt-precorrin-6A reductase [Aquihabitans sp. G128]QXC59882.1 precorrin-6A/cobalt-precorrin-6A reductase [Aquihabitans sp. G128]